MDWKKVLWVVLALDLVAVNGTAGYLMYQARNENVQTQTPAGNQITTSKTEYIDKCGEECMAAIAARVKELESVTTSVTPTPAGKVVVKNATKVKTRTVSYATVPGSGSTVANGWTDITGTDFYFNKADYPGLVEVYFEVNMSLFNGNGMAYVRLFDVSNGVGVQGSDVQTASQTNTLVTSGQVTFWAGKNLIRVQAKSLTADTTVYTSGRLRIVTEN